MAATPTSNPTTATSKSAVLDSAHVCAGVVVLCPSVLCSVRLDRAQVLTGTPFTQSESVALVSALRVLAQYGLPKILRVKVWALARPPSLSIWCLLLLCVLWNGVRE